MNYINNETPVGRVKLVGHKHKHNDAIIHIAGEKVQEFVNNYYGPVYDTIDAYTLDNEFIGSTEL